MSKSGYLVLLRTPQSVLNLILSRISSARWPLVIPHANPHLPDTRSEVVAVSCLESTT